ncbi:phosphoribosylamine--glycine ligase, partial [Candidatus Curtissbacteria bacterium]|nr:phosphoribosylamine--glycine ligase [Candidatus Curtissbacteria bacterium]
TCGGRVLGVTAYGKTMLDARKKVYPLLGKGGVHFEGMHFRKDIGRP